MQAAEEARRNADEAETHNAEIASALATVQAQLGAALESHAAASAASAAREEAARKQADLELRELRDALLSARRERKANPLKGAAATISEAPHHAEPTDTATAHPIRHAPRCEGETVPYPSEAPRTNGSLGAASASAISPDGHTTRKSLLGTHPSDAPDGEVVTLSPAASVAVEGRAVTESCALPLSCGDSHLISPATSAGLDTVAADQNRGPAAAPTETVSDVRTGMAGAKAANEVEWSPARHDSRFEAQSLGSFARSPAGHLQGSNASRDERCGGSQCASTAGALPARVSGTNGRNSREGIAPRRSPDGNPQVDGLGKQCASCNERGGANAFRAGLGYGREGISGGGEPAFLCSDDDAASGPAVGSGIQDHYAADLDPSFLAAGGYPAPDLDGAGGGAACEAWLAGQEGCRFRDKMADFARTFAGGTTAEEATAGGEAARRLLTALEEEARSAWPATWPTRALAEGLERHLMSLIHVKVNMCARSKRMKGCRWWPQPNSLSRPERPSGCAHVPRLRTAASIFSPRVGIWCRLRCCRGQSASRTIDNSRLRHC